MFTIRDIADHVQVEQSASQPYSTLDIIANFDPTLKMTYGRFCMNTPISDLDYYSFIDAWDSYESEGE